MINYIGLLHDWHFWIAVLMFIGFVGNVASAMSDARTHALCTLACWGNALVFFWLFPMLTGVAPKLVIQRAFQMITGIG
jgi:hypothetical protein